MKRSRFFVLIAVVSFCLFAWSGGAARGATILKAASPWPKTHDNNTLLFKFCALVEKKTNGSLKIQWAGGPELFKASDLPTAAAAGTIDVFHYPIGYLGRKIPEAGIYDAYPAKRTFDNVAQVNREALKFLGPLCEKKEKIKPFGSTTFFPMYLWLKKPVKTIDELQGLKVRVHGGLAPHIMRAIGVNVVTMPTPDVYMALERGVIDGALRNLSSFINFREYEFCKYGINIPLFVGGTPIFISLRKWSKLNDAQKQAFSEVGDEMNDLSAKFWKKKEEEFMNQLKTEGAVLSDPSPEFAAEWHKRAAEGAKKAALKMSPDGAEKIISILETYAK